jgi:NAD-dependent SIR2 family protein deacetylase
LVHTQQFEPASRIHSDLSVSFPQVKPDIVFFGERLPERFYRLAGA